jgi:hypothetical protein
MDMSPNVRINPARRASPIHIRAQHDRAKRPDQETHAERHQNQHQRSNLAARGEERSTYRRRIIAKHREVVHLQKIAGSNSNYSLDTYQPFGRGGYRFGNRR